MPQRAVFLDRDGVLIEDSHLLTDPAAVRLIPGAGSAVRRLRAHGFVVVVVSNQAVVARGLCDESGVRSVQERIQELLVREGGLEASVDEFRFCPHHPHADVPEYRCDCACRKPRPGMILDAARALDLELSRASSFVVGDRLSDIAAGRLAGCGTVLVESGRHRDPPIESPESIGPDCVPDVVLPDLESASQWILSHTLIPTRGP